VELAWWKVEEVGEVALYTTIDVERFGLNLHAAHTLGCMDNALNDNDTALELLLSNHNGWLYSHR
jgi:hypothetical protein